MNTGLNCFGSNESTYTKRFIVKQMGALRAADALEKISAGKPEWLAKHRDAIRRFLTTARDKEFKWHLAQMAARLEWPAAELADVWDALAAWATDSRESKIVRVNALQALHDLAGRFVAYQPKFRVIKEQVRPENIPSINARLNKL